MLRLSDTLRHSLLTEPETGMGYQRVEATLRDNKTERGIAFNAEWLVLDDETQVARRMYPNTNPYTILLKRSAQSSGNEIKALRVLPRAGMVFRAIEKKAAPAKDASKEKTKADEVFKRFSPFRMITASRRMDDCWRAVTRRPTKTRRMSRQVTMPLLVTRYRTLTLHPTRS